MRLRCKQIWTAYFWTIRPCDGSLVRWACILRGFRPSLGGHQANRAHTILSAGKGATRCFRPKDVSAGMHAFCAVRKKSPQTCETFSPSEQTFRRRACLLKHPRKVSAAIPTFSATGKFFVQRLPSVNTIPKPKFQNFSQTA